jgi:hypothetical protein
MKDIERILAQVVDKDPDFYCSQPKLSEYTICICYQGDRNFYFNIRNLKVRVFGGQRDTMKMILMKAKVQRFVNKNVTKKVTA